MLNEITLWSLVNATDFKWRAFMGLILKPAAETFYLFISFVCRFNEIKLLFDFLKTDA